MIFKKLWPTPPATLPYAASWTTGEWQQFTETMRLFLLCASVSSDPVVKKLAELVPKVPVFPFARGLVLNVPSLGFLVVPENPSPDAIARTRNSFQSAGIDQARVPRSAGSWELIKSPTDGQMWIDSPGRCAQGRGIVMSRACLAPSCRALGVYAHELAHWTQPDSMSIAAKEAEAKVAEQQILKAYSEIAHPDLLPEITARLSVMQ